MIELSDRLKSLRKTSGLSLEKIGKATGHSKAHMWELETGKTLNPRLSTLRSLAKFYGMTIDELLSCQPPSDFVAIVAQLRPLLDQHFQAGLKRGAEIVREHWKKLPTATWEGYGLVEAEQAILGEMDGD